MVQPLWLVWMVLEVQSRNEGLVPSDNHHDQKVRDHDHIDEGQHHDHHNRFAAAFGNVNPFDRFVECRGVPEQGNEVQQLFKKEPDINNLGCDQSKVEWNLQPPAREHALFQPVGGAVGSSFR